MQVNKDNIIKKLEVAVRLRDSGNFEEAVQVLRDILDYAPSYLGTYFLLGLVFMDMEYYCEAADMFRKVVTEKPDDEQASLGLFFSLFNLLQYKEAFAEMERFLRISDKSEYINMLARDALKKGLTVDDNDKAKLIELCRNIGESFIGLG